VLGLKMGSKGKKTSSPVQKGRVGRHTSAKKRGGGAGHQHLKKNRHELESPFDRLEKASHSKS